MLSSHCSKLARAAEIVGQPSLLYHLASPSRAQGSTIARLHDTLQIAFGWTDEHLHQFLMRGKPYRIWKPEGISFCDDPHQVQLRDFPFRYKERWMYEYNLTDSWQHEIRLEQILPLDPGLDPERCGRYT
jgi:hypothetical protein